MNPLDPFPSTTFSSPSQNLWNAQTLLASSHLTRDAASREWRKLFAAAGNQANFKLDDIVSLDRGTCAISNAEIAKKAHGFFALLNSPEVQACHILGLMNCSLQPTFDWPAFIDALKDMRSLTDLSLIETPITVDGISALKGIPLTRLTLLEGCVEDAELEALASTVMGIPTLELLVLSENNISTAGAAHFLNLIKSHSSLATIELSANDYIWSIQAILEAGLGLPSLKTIDLSEIVLSGEVLLAELLQLRQLAETSTRPAPITIILSTEAQDARVKLLVEQPPLNRLFKFQFDDDDVIENNSAGSSDNESIVEQAAEEAADSPLMSMLRADYSLISAAEVKDLWKDFLQRQDSEDPILSKGCCSIKGNHRPLTSPMAFQGLIAYLEESQSCDGIEFYNCNFQDSYTWNAFIEALSKAPSILSLIFFECSLTPQQIQSLSQIWHLQNLSICGQELDEVGMRALADLIKKIPLRSLDLTSCFIEDEDLPVLFRQKAPSLRSLNLNGNRLNMKEINLAAFVKQLPSLKILNLGNNSPDFALQQIADFLQEPYEITRIDFSETFFSEASLRNWEAIMLIESGDFLKHQRDKVLELTFSCEERSRQETILMEISERFKHVVKLNIRSCEPEDVVEPKTVKFSSTLQFLIDNATIAAHQQTSVLSTPGFRSFEQRQLLKVFSDSAVPHEESLKILWSLNSASGLEDLSMTWLRRFFRVFSIAPNGDCLFNALKVALKMKHSVDLRSKIADHMAAHADSFMDLLDPRLLPEITGIDKFPRRDQKIERFRVYCELVKKSSLWGGLVEIIAFASYLKERHLPHRFHVFDLSNPSTFDLRDGIPIVKDPGLTIGDQGSVVYLYRMNELHYGLFLCDTARRADENGSIQRPGKKVRRADSDLELTMT